MNKEQFGAMSLPFGLYCVGINPEVIYKVLSVHFGAIILHRVVSDKTNHDFPLPIKHIKYIIHPLTDITKPIEHKGEVFVPEIVLNRDYPCEMIHTNIATWSFRVVFKLIEWHFDIAGLIEKGEAIDVNTLPENPYK
jgi:hypothetical protein